MKFNSPLSFNSSLLFCSNLSTQFSLPVETLSLGMFISKLFSLLLSAPITSLFAVFSVALIAEMLKIQTRNNNNNKGNFFFISNHAYKIIFINNIIKNNIGYVFLFIKLFGKTYIYIKMNGNTECLIKVVSKIMT